MCASDVADRSDGVGEGRRAQVRGVAAGPRRGAHADGGQRRRQARLGRAHQARAARPAARAQGGARAPVQRATQVLLLLYTVGRLTTTTRSLVNDIVHGQLRLSAIYRFRMGEVLTLSHTAK